jgi:hypothetical protein
MGMRIPKAMYPWVGRFGLFTLLILIPAVLFLLNAFLYSGNMCSTIILVVWIGMGVIVVEELMRRREF